MNITFNRVTNKNTNNYPKPQSTQAFQGNIEKETSSDIVEIANKKITRQQKSVNKVMARQQKIIDRAMKRAEKFSNKIIAKAEKKAVKLSPKKAEKLLEKAQERADYIIGKMEIKIHKNRLYTNEKAVKALSKDLSLRKVKILITAAIAFFATSKMAAAQRIVRQSVNTVV